MFSPLIFIANDINLYSALLNLIYFKETDAARLVQDITIEKVRCAENALLE